MGLSMEYDRYAQDKGMFIISMICLLLFLTLIPFALYILPALIWSWHYDIPEFTITFREWIRRAYEITDPAAGWWVFLCFLVPGIIAGFISLYTSNTIDNKIYGIQPEEPTSHTALKRDFQQTVGFSLKILLLAALVVAGVFFVEWLIAIPPGV